MRDVVNAVLGASRRDEVSMRLASRIVNDDDLVVDIRTCPLTQILQEVRQIRPPVVDRNADRHARHQSTQVFNIVFHCTGLG